MHGWRRRGPRLHPVRAGGLVWSIASTLPGVLAPLLGGLVIGLTASLGNTSLGYRAVFGLAALFLVMGAVFVFQIQESLAARPRRTAGNPA